MTIYDFGYENQFDLKEGQFIGRVAVSYGQIYSCMTVEGMVSSEVSGLMMKERSIDHFPAVGDWVALDRKSDSGGRAIIHEVLPRKSMLSRKVAGGRMDEQVIASNMDTIFICTSANAEFNYNRLDRYMGLSKDSGANVKVVLTKIDLMDEIDELISNVELFYGVEVYPISSYTGEGLKELSQSIEENEVISVIGSSGVGKSTLINYLLGSEEMKVSHIRNDDQGRHTTTHKEMKKIAGGGILIDTPGMREIQLIGHEDTVSNSFEDIESLAQSCKFRDCTHKSEPGCSVKAALESGELTELRFKNYNKMLRENEYIKKKLAMKGGRR